MVRRQRWLELAAASALCTALFCHAGQARAQEADPVSPTGKGIAGGVLLGAELPMITLAIIGIDEWWAYLIAGGAGAAGGAVGGYFVEQTGEAEPALYMLAGGMALVIPTLVATLDATAYEPGKDEEEAEEGEQPSEETEGEEPASPSPEASPEQPTGRLRVPGGAIVGIAPAGLRLGPPIVELRASTTQIAHALPLDTHPQLEWNLPVVRASF